MQLKDFQMQVWEYYLSHGRHDMPWRQPEANGDFDPYKIMVSEIMLQQTQVQRVIPKFLAFTEQFPTVAALAEAPLAQVLDAWSGLGYNRRAKFLWQAASVIAHEHQGRFPRATEALVGLPGIGINTAGAIMAYAFDEPVTFVETNVRTVFIHHFFAHAEQVTDAEIRQYGDALIDLLRQDPSDELTPRIWYWALMDYGTYLKQVAGNASRRSVSYAKQSRFEGSRRQIRGAVLRTLRDAPMRQNDLAECIEDDRLQSVIEDLVKEKMISLNGEHYQLGDMMVQF